MLFTDVRLQNFRSYHDSSFEIDPGVTIVVGPNTAGKTNLVEALLLVASGKTYRHTETLIRRGQPWGRVDAHTNDNRLRSVKLRRSNDTSTDKEIEIDAKVYKRLPAHHRQPVVLFEPNNLQLLYREPASRRDYLDNFIESLDASYSKTITHYQRVLTQRNTLLKQPRLDPSQLFVWNLRLVELAVDITAKRYQLLTTLNDRLGALYSTITGHKASLMAVYKTIVSQKAYSASLLKLLEVNLERDHARGFTGYGPHRDDMYFTFNEGGDMSMTASRGEIRTLLLCLKIIELELIEQATGTRPLLLLDDVFSELDSSRRKALTSFLQGHQTIITTTDADVVIKHFVGKCTIIPLGWPTLPQKLN